VAICSSTLPWRPSPCWGAAHLFLAPIFAGGFVLAAQQAEQGRELKLRALFAGFDRAPRALLNVGMLYLALLLLAMMLLSAAMPLLGLQLIARRMRRSCPGWKARSGCSCCSAPR
jgi:hypothetical protein